MKKYNKFKFFIKESLASLLKTIFLLTDELILLFDRKGFCILYNIRSVALEWKTRFECNDINNKYMAISGEIRQYFENNIRN